MFRSLASIADRRPWRIVLIALIFFGVSGAIGGPLAGRLDNDDDFDDRATESVQATRALERATGIDPSSTLVALVRTGPDVRTDAAARAKVQGVVDRLAAQPGVAARPISFYDTQDPTFVSRDGRSTIVVAPLRPGADENVFVELGDEWEQDGVFLGGNLMIFSQVSEQITSDITTAELVAFPLLFLLALFVFRSVVSAALMLAVAGLSVLGSFLVLSGINEQYGISIYALNLVNGLGLGLAVDYSLFIISRHREESARGGEPAEVLRRTLNTAGRTVVFSALTVAAAMASLTVFPQRFLRSMGLGGATVALLAAIIAVTVLPAALRLLGPRVNALDPLWFRARRPEAATAASGGFWYRLSHLVLRRPGAFAAGTAALLILVGLPFLGVRFISADASVLPEHYSGRIVAEALDTEFPVSNQDEPLYVAVSAPESAGDQVRAYAERVGSLPNADPGTARYVGEGMWRVDVFPQTGTHDARTDQLVRDIRATPTPFGTELGGGPAANFDQLESLKDHLPISVAILMTTTLILLFLMTGSLVLPIKHLVMNMLSLSAAFGILVLVFQDGHLEGLLDFTSAGGLEATQPVLLFALAFGLSTDYGVFLLTRIKENRDHGMPNNEAVAVGLERTGRIVTAAAALFTIAIGAFGSSQIIFIKEVGLGTALAVLIDATVVRALLVPSLMGLLGEWNWWAPRPLRAVHRRFGLHEAPA